MHIYDAEQIGEKVTRSNLTTLQRLIIILQQLLPGGIYKLLCPGGSRMLSILPKSDSMLLIIVQLL